MLTLTFSPSPMNSGTWISAPVSTVAGFVPAFERLPCRPGSVCVTVRTTDAGSSTESGWPSWNETMQSVPSSRYFALSPTSAYGIMTWS